VSGPATSPSIRYTGRLAGDEPGLMTQGEADLAVGSGSQTDASGRWGDYSMLAIDPADDCTFWYTQQYYAATSAAGWRTRIGSFAFPSCLAASILPTVSVTATTPTATEAGLTPGVFTVARTGDLSAPLTLTYTVSGTATPDSDYVALPGNVTIPVDSATATIVVTPIDDLLAEPDETVVLTLAVNPAYKIGSPGGAIVTIVSDDLPADLTVTAVTAPAVAGAGSSMGINDTTKNQGSGLSAASATGFYLSTNTLLDAADVLLGSRQVPSLAPGASNSGSTTLTIPAGTATGTYYIVAKADVNNAIVETQEGNNTKVSGIVAIGPDLVVTVVTVPATAAAGGSIVVSDTTKNQGGGSAPASTTSFYLSANTLLDAADVLLGSRAVALLAAGVTDSASTSLTIPPGTAVGAYYVIAKADATNAVVETQEGNNLRVNGPLKIGPDLVVASVAAPSLAGAGSAIVVTDTTKNQGAGDATASTTGFYLSTNLILDAADVFLGSRAVPALAAGATDAASTSLVIPAGTPTGSYFILAKADLTNGVVESVETNNVSWSPSVRVGPDLVVSAFSAPTPIVAGSTVTVNDSTKNQGGGPAPASTTQYYLSTNTVFDASDVLVGSRAVAPLAPGASDTAASAITIPAGTAPGNYYLIAAADGSNTVVETFETNNTRLIFVQISAP
jgi:subtilase family serine protease